MDREFEEMKNDSSSDNDSDNNIILTHEKRNDIDNNKTSCLLSNRVMALILDYQDIVVHDSKTGLERKPDCKDYEYNYTMHCKVTPTTLTKSDKDEYKSPSSMIGFANEKEMNRTKSKIKMQTKSHVDNFGPPNYVLMHRASVASQENINSFGIGNHSIVLDFNDEQLA